MADEGKIDILFVDDEQEVLDSFRRVFRHREFRVHMTTSPSEALSLAGGLEGGLARLAVVVSDMRMPGMDGLNLLSRIKEISPDTVGVVLTGHSDVETLIDAVNAGNVFRFLTKPCPPEAVGKAILAAVQQYQILAGSREIPVRALAGCARIWEELAGALLPAVRRRGSRISALALETAARLGAPVPTGLAEAARFSQIGLAFLPPAELAAFLERPTAANTIRYPELGADLLANSLPDIEVVSHMIRHQRRGKSPLDDPDAPLTGGIEEDVGAAILAAATAFEDIVGETTTPAGDAIAKLATDGGHHPDILTALATTVQKQKDNNKKGGSR